MTTAATHRRARRLVRRYLDPGRTWGPARETTLRAHLADCATCRLHYGRAVGAHRLALGLPADAPSGFERRRLRDAAVGAATASQAAATAEHLPWLLALGLGAAAAAALLLPVPGDLGAPRDGDEILLTRGAHDDEPRPTAGLGISGVTQDGREYEVVATGRADHADWFRFYYTSQDPALAHLFVLGLQPGADEIAWYAPLPPDETRSLAIAPGRQVKLPFESRLAARHRAGPLAVVALFTAEPLTTARVADALDPDLAALAPSDLSRAIRRRLGLAPGDVVQVLTTRVVAHEPAGGSP